MSLSDEPHPGSDHTPPEPGNLLLRLRAATRDAHGRVEALLDLAGDGLDRPHYVRALAALHEFWAACEPLVGALLREPAFLAPRRRLHLLRADLAELGHTPPAASACPPPALRTRAEAWGSLYVMEGSTLGGRSLLRQLERRTGLAAHGDGMRYFAGYGAATGPMWRAFLERLDALPTRDADGVVAGAVATFSRLEEWLREERPGDAQNCFSSRSM